MTTAYPKIIFDFADFYIQIGIYKIIEQEISDFMLFEKTYNNEPQGRRRKKEDILRLNKEERIRIFNYNI